MATEVVYSGVDKAHADCSRCELRANCARTTVLGERPADWEAGGLMVLGEGPTATDLAVRRPFTGGAGRLLDALLEGAGIRRERCWLTNATLGLPPRLSEDQRKGSLHDRFPMALYSCLPRLEEEIRLAAPRVIVTLGPSAFTAIAGHEIHKTKLVPNPCDNVACDPDTRKLKHPCLVCANGSCDWYAALETENPDAEVAKLRELFGGQCPSCHQSIARLRPRTMKCPRCKGRKKREEAFVSFNDPYTLVGREGVAGAVFRAEDLPSRLDQFGVRYVIPTYSMSYCLQPMREETSGYITGQFAARAALDHLAKARELLTREPRFSASAKLTRDPAEVRAWFAQADRDVAVDIETNAIGGPWAPTKITVIGFACASQPEALVVDTRALTGHALDSPLLDALQLFLEDPSRGKVFHHGSYDRLVILRLWGIEVAGVVGDTLLEHHALYPDEEQGLGFCAHELLDAPAWKGGSHAMEQDQQYDLSGYESLDELALYNARDTRATALLDEIMRGPGGSGGRLRAEGVEAAHKLDLEMQRIAIGMEVAGLPVSRERFRSIEASCERVMDEALREMRSLLGMPEFTPRGEQLTKVLFDPTGPCRLPVLERTAKGAPSASKEVLKRMSDQHPVIPHLLRWRKYEYALSHYIRGAGLEPGADGRIHPQWKVHGTVTGRWSSSPNFQNWPKGDGVDEATNLRSAIVAPPGRMLIGADYAQLEMRIMANLSGDTELIRRCMEADESDKLNPEKDPHSYVAAMTFGSVFLNGDKRVRKALRDVAKRVVYGLNYGAGVATIIAAIYDGGYEGPPLTTRLIEATIAAYFRAFPGVPRWRDEQVRTCTAAREVRSPIIGRRRHAPLGEMSVTVMYNYPIQSGAADVMNTRLLVLDQRLRDADPSALFVAQVHDAIYIECDEDRIDQVEAVVGDSLTVETSLRPGAAPMLYLASPSHAQTWDKAA